ncbi:MAG: hypothetical protein PHP42_10925 [Bacteroidota bacterium]|nr:hypothetical protein [Bacteroidota bacterium]
MGIVTLGPSSDILLKLAKLNGATVFVETGTFRGETTRWASKYFDTVFTIERAESIYNLHSAELSKLKGVKPLLGDSRTVLPKVVAEIKDRKSIFWLDGHWSGGETAGADDECPVLNELAILSGRKNDIILIDDARLFLSAPPQPHKPAEWPTIVEIIDAMSEREARPFIQIIDDIIFIIPDKEPLKSILVKYAQERSIPFWTKKENFQPRDLRKDDFKTIVKKIRNRFIRK